LVFPEVEWAAVQGVQVVGVCLLFLFIFHIEKKKKEK
jgi:hypothetical protein